MPNLNIHNFILPVRRNIYFDFDKEPTKVEQKGFWPRLVLRSR